MCVQVSPKLPTTQDYYCNRCDLPLNQEQIVRIKAIAKCCFCRETAYLITAASTTENSFPQVMEQDDDSGEVSFSKLKVILTD